MHTGQNIRRLRTNKSLSREGLASTVGLTDEDLERIERCEVEPPISGLMRIASALSTDISALIYGKEFEAKKAIVTRKAERVRVERARSLVYESLAPYYSGRHMEPLEVLVLPESGANESSRHSGEEFHYVLDGILKIVVDGAIHVLYPGDTIYFDASMPHELSAVDRPARVLAAIYNQESMAQVTKSRRMRDLIQAAKHVGGTTLALVCPDPASLEAAAHAVEEGVVKSVWVFGDPTARDAGGLRRPDRYHFVEVAKGLSDYHAQCAAKAVDAVRTGRCQLLMKGDINTSIFLKAVLHKERGIGAGRRLSMVSIFELPGIDRLIFLSDPAINPSLAGDKDFESSRDIVHNAVEVAQGMGVLRPKVAILDANEMPSEALPTTLHAKRLSEMVWEDAEVFGPLSYDLALYPDAVEHKGLTGNPVAGMADILIVPHVSGGNFLYKAWAFTMGAEVANVVLGARVPIIITSRSDSDMTKFLTICASSVHSLHLSATARMPWP